MRKSHLLILGLILLVGLFFRSYQIVERLEFAHDGDLYSWIVKDIIVDNHPRLIGQLTSAPGIFIGGLFYYLLIPFFLIANMDPVGVTYFAIIIGLSTIFSLYFVLSKLFNTTAGLIAASLYATLLTIVNADRWIVPTITTNLWVVWYLYVVIQITRGNYKLLPLLGILIGLIWHVHIALIPTLVAIPVAMILAKKLPNIRQAAQLIIALLITSLPLIIFEARHGFGQTSSLINNFLTPQAGATGLYKLTSVLNMITKNIYILFLEPQPLKLTANILFIPTILLPTLWLVKKQLLQQKELLIFLTWIAGVIIFFGLSSSPISEYYFSNINIIFIVIISLYFYSIFKTSFSGRAIVTGILLLITIKNGYFVITQDYYHKGYVERKAIVDYIKTDTQKNKYPCIGISYITAAGENVGFRYLLYLSNIQLVHPSFDVPVYNIFVPDELAPEGVEKKFGHIGINPPTQIPSKEVIEKTCQTPNTNLTDPMFGYVE